MKEFKVLKILDKLSWLYTKAGVDYNILRLIINTKLTMDGRRKATVFNNDESKKKKESNEFYKALLMYAFIGLFLGLMLIFNINKMYLMSGFFSIIMFMILTIFISDFSYVILDVRDKNIISTKGIDNKTINAAKITHVFIYMIYLTLALVGISFIISLKYGVVYFLVFFIEIILIDIFMIIITALAYLLVLKFFDGEKLKDIINFVQIGLSIFMVVIYQIVPRLFSIIDLSKIDYNNKVWHLLIPPMWFAAPLSIIAGEEVTNIKIMMSILALMVPVISIIVYLKFMPTFEKNLQKLNNNEANIKEKGRLLIKINNLFCKDNTERAFFNFAIGIVSSEREFKLKVYPNLALGVVLPIVFMMPGIDRNNPIGILESLRNSRQYLSIYAFALAIPNILIMSRYSEKYMGAWIYQIAPIKNMSSVFRGVLKGVIYKFVLIPYSIISLIYIMIFGPKAILHLIIVFLVLISLVIFNFIILKKSLPFSKKFEATNGGESVGIVFIHMVSVLIALGIHFALSNNKIASYIYIFILIIFNLLLWKYSFNISKEKLMN